MNLLEQRIVERIRQEGALTFEQFMQMALYEPGLGYYASPAIDMGKAADYFTSSNVNALFGAMVAAQVADIWRLMGQPENFVLLEQGGGRGLFALDVLDELKDRHPECYEGLNYQLVEISAPLRQKQQALLRMHADKVHWFETLDAVAPFSGVFFSNELVDAFPVHLVEFTRDGLNEVYVTVKEGALAEELGPCSTDELRAHFEERGISMPAGYRTEVNLNAKRWIFKVAERLREGYVLTVDYGFNTWDYYTGERSTGSLICYHQHATNDRPLERPGEQDITSHVDFSSLAGWGKQGGLEPTGFVTQSSFLLNMDIDRRLSELHGTLPETEYLALAAQVRTLLMPAAMGETHKILVQRRHRSEKSLRCLRARNRLDYLMARKP